MDAVLEAKGVTKRFGNASVLDDLDFSLMQGEVVAVIGPSGTGKTTLLRILAGLEPPDLGRVDAKGRIGIVFQTFNLWPHLSVIENVVLPLRKVKKLGEKEAVMTAIQALEKVKIQHKAAFFPSQLSGGEAQRAAIARTLAMEPEILLFDEVTSSLSPELVREVAEVISTLAKEGKTMVIVTHCLSLASAVANRIVVLNEGKIIEQGTPAQIFYSPQNAFTQKFVSQALEIMA